MYTVKRKSRNVCQVLIENSGDFEQRFLLSADRHWDNPMSDWAMQKKHLEQAKKYGAGIIDVGDLFCCMQGKYDKRSNKSSLRPEHKEGNYFDLLVSTAADFFESYAKQIIVLAMGNHETKIQDKHEINITDNLAKELNYRTGSKITNGGYSGWIDFIFIDQTNGIRTHKKLFYHHGAGGGGPVTKGVIQTNRRAVFTPDADFVLTGHIHEEWNLTLVRHRLDNNGRTYLDEQVHIQLPTYKDEYIDGYSGYHIENARPPKPIGAVWLNFKKENKEPISFDLLRAK